MNKLFVLSLTVFFGIFINQVQSFINPITSSQIPQGYLQPISQVNSPQPTSQIESESQTSSHNALIKQINNVSTTDFIVVVGDYSLIETFKNATESELDAAIQNLQKQTINAGASILLNQTINFEDYSGDKRLFFINNSTKKLKYEFNTGIQGNGTLMTMLIEVETGLDNQIWSSDIKENYDINLTIGNNLEESNIEIE